MSLPWIRRVSVELLWLVPEDWARHGSAFVAIGLSCCPGPPAGRCHAAVCPRTFGYLVVLLTEVTPYWMFLSRPREV